MSKSLVHYLEHCAWMVVVTIAKTRAEKRIFIVLIVRCVPTIVAISFLLKMMHSGILL
jgi:hypothetical protein